MDPFTVFPNAEITSKGIISKYFVENNILSVHDACQYIHNVPYGYNSTRDDILIIFKERYGSCTTKHAVIATLAEELGIEVHKMVGVYRMDEDIVTGTGMILDKYHLPYLPMVHCFLIFENKRVDLTEGNDNGKNYSIEDFLFTQKVIPNISERDEYMLYKTALKDNILKRREFEDVIVIDVLQARAEGITLLHSLVENR